MDQVFRGLHHQVGGRRTGDGSGPSTPFEFRRHGEGPVIRDRLFGADRGDPVTRVVLVGEQAMIRAGFSALLDAEPDIDVVAEAADGEQALRVVYELRPDVVVMDVRVPVTDGLETTRRITADRALAGTHVVILTTVELAGHALDALRAGARGFVLEDGEPADLLHAVRVVAAGGAVLAPSVTLRVIEEVAQRRQGISTPPLTAWKQLTTREREVLTLVARGLNNGEISEALEVSPLTARTHVARIRSKLGARDRVQLVVMARQGHSPAPVPSCPTM
jgi:DNA-binding NarL/FixJ family response regulator